MLKFLLLIIFFAGSAMAQQNFFNIPSGQVTPDHEFFYQHQVNAFAMDSMSSKQHFVWGTGPSTEVGFNFLNYYPQGKKRKDKEAISGPQSNILAPSFFHAFRFDNNVSVNVGGQVGLTHMGVDRAKYLTGKSYVLLSYFNERHHFRLTGGDWFSGTRYNGPGDPHGMMFGGEWMFAEGFHLMIDTVTGNTKNSVSVFGGMIDLKPGVQLCAGYLVPNPDSTEEHGLVLELNLFTLGPSSRSK